MRKRSVGINVRVSVTEKKKVTMLIKKCEVLLLIYLLYSGIEQSMNGQR